MTLHARPLFCGARGFKRDEQAVCKIFHKSCIDKLRKKFYSILDNSPEQGSDTKLNGGSAALSQHIPARGEEDAHTSSLFLYPRTSDILPEVYGMAGACNSVNFWYNDKNGAGSPREIKKARSVEKMIMNEAVKNLLERRSCRAYTAEKISDEQLETILLAGQYAPTARGTQSPIIAVVKDAEKIAAVEELNAAVMGKTGAHPFYGATTLLVVFGDGCSPFCQADGNLVIANLLNAANAVGADSCYIWRAKEAFESEKGQELKKAWGIPESYVGIGNVILGKGAEGAIKEPAPRKADYVRYV